MKLLYNLLLFKASIVLPILALFNKKISLFVEGRKDTFSKIAKLKNEKTVWFHAASLGEFEQARPIIESIKNNYPKHKILVTFFSPSGYEIRKNYNLADVVCYLPVDRRSKVKKFVEIVNPKLAIFIKYEFWPNLLNELKQKEIPTILVSGILRKNSVFFKWYGGFMRKSLTAFHHFFVQDKNSKKLLQKLNFNSVTVSGDTRFDRVSKILQQDNELDFISEFKNNNYTIVAGSTWKEDEDFLIDYINNSASEVEKIIIAPHNIHQKEIEKLRKSILKKTILYSEKEDVNLKEYQVFIIDTIGLLTKIYAFADVAYVGGGLKTGLHNILEPATFGIPIVFGGKNHQKFKEATDLISLKGAVNIQIQKEFSTIFKTLKKDEKLRFTMGNINKKYVAENIGATKIIMNYITKKLH